MAGRFRHDPPAPRSAWISRPRLVRQLGRRFEVGVLTVTAPAGYGKTAALSEALAEDVDAAGRRDCWLQCRADDEHGDGLGTAILLSLDPEVVPQGEVTAMAITDTMSAASPDEICLVLDDVHLVGAGSAGAQLIADVVAALPRNGHVVLSGRSIPPVTTIRGLLDGDVERIDAETLEFDDAEVAEVLAESDRLPDDVVRWPALVALAYGHRRDDTVEYILDEVAGPVGSEERRLLDAYVHLTEIEEDLLRAVHDDADSEIEVLSGLPLVQRSADGSFQLHDLWREALAPTDGPNSDPEVTRLLRSIARARSDAGLHVEAARHYAAGGDMDGLNAAACAVIARPLMSISLDEVRSLSRVLARWLPDRPITSLVAMAETAVLDEEATAVAYETIAEEALLAGDEQSEVLALYNAANMRSVLDPASMPEPMAARAEQLVEAGHDEATVTVVAVRANNIRCQGEPELARDLLETLLPLRGLAEDMVFSFGMNDLGLPEQVPTPAVATDAASSAMIPSAAALWLRGDVSPELAHSEGAALVSSSESNGFRHLLTPVYATFSLVAQAAGEPVRARELASDAQRTMVGCRSVPMRSFAALADVVCTLMEGDEEEARRRLERLLDELPIGAWPPRPYMFALPTVHLLAPHTREALASCRFGPSFTAVQQAAQALVALVEEDDPAPAARLDWSRPDLLRAHVLPPHLALLGAAASAAGNPEVGPVLASLGDQRTLLSGAATLRHGPTATWAAARIASLPARPAYDIGLRLLGGTELSRGATPVVDRDWTNRDRVRQLMAYLALHRSVSRRRIAEALWPDLPLDRALGNLRVNLAHLQKVLQPDRPQSDKPWFIGTDGEWVTLAADGVTIDVESFERSCERAGHLDGENRTTAAIDELSRAVELYGGEFLKDWPDAEWAQVERYRLRSLAIGVRCRLGELLLARGEPEQAARHATEVLGIEPLQERACRLLVHALTAQGDRATAWRAIGDLLGQLAHQGLRPEPATARLARSYGLDVPGT